MQKFVDVLRRFHRDERGVFAVIFAIVAVVVIAFGGAVVDYVTLEQARTRAQTSLDAATLTLQPLINNAAETDETIRQKAEALVLERLGSGAIKAARVHQVQINRDKGELLLGGEFTIETIFVKLVGVNELSAAITSQATKGTANVEVAIALDVTGSMAELLPSGETRLSALKNATKGLVSTVLALNKGDNYAKVSLIPYSQAVNAGQYATALRGPVREQKTLEKLTWYDGAAVSITKVTKGSTTTITAPGHKLKVNDYVFVWNTSYTTMNLRGFKVSAVTTDTISLSGLNTSLVIGTISGGSVVKCLVDNCDPVITSTKHGFAAEEPVQITSALGITEFNGNIYTAGNVTPDSFSLNGATFSRFNTYTPNSGRLHCLTQTATSGCPQYRFVNATNAYAIHSLTTCVTERSANGPTDAPPSTSLMGRNYPASANGCTSGEIVPLTREKSRLDAAVDGLVASGSTSGSLGVLWSWYMLSPKLGSIWPATSQPAPYLERHLMKAAVIMTDGEFNTVHCEGVASALSSTAGSFSWANRQDQINCAAPNGAPYRQAQTYCDAMKNNTGIVVFTVGLGITEGTDAAKALRSCASGDDKYFLASNSAELTARFQDIARQITALRLTR